MWTDDSIIQLRPGGTTEFAFMESSVVFGMRIDELGSPRRMVRSCVGGPSDWVGTALNFQLTPMDTGKTSDIPASAEDIRFRVGQVRKQRQDVIEATSSA